MEIRSTVSLRVGSAWRLGDGSVTCAGAAAAEIVLLDLGGTTEEIAGAIGPSGYLRAMLCANRDERGPRHQQSIRLDAHPADAARQRATG
jgi:hypothetical protein